jgi:hypothetical protein
MDNKFNVIVYNCVDMLSHVRTEMNVMKELAEDEAAYRSITASWFEHSPLFETIKKIAQKKVRVIITTDHGSIRVKNPVKIIGDKSTSTNLRYKQGRNLSYNAKELFGVKNPADLFLPKQFAFAFAFPLELLLVLNLVDVLVIFSDAILSTFGPKISSIDTSIFNAL